MIIRNAKESDIDRINQMYDELLAMHIDARPDLFKNACAANFSVENLTADDKISIVAESEGRTFAMCFANVSQKSDAKVVNIYDFFVENEFRRKGVATKMYDKMCEIAREMSADRVELMVWGFNNQAVEFYKSLGMKTQRYVMEISL